MTQTNVLLADHQCVVREAMHLLIEQRSDLHVVGEVGNGADVLEAVVRYEPNLLIMEQALPGMPTVDLIRKAIESCSRTKVLMLSSHENRSAVEDALRSGASGYVVKTACSKELMEAIDVVRDGRSYLSPSVAHHLVNAISHPGDSASCGTGSLTTRERQVVQLIAEGLSSKEIAAHLGVSHKTVESHRASVMEKLDIHKASALVRYAIREGLVAP